MLTIDIPAGATVSVGFQMLQEDIDGGEREDCWSCPLARCINRTLPDYESEVDGNYIKLYEVIRTPGYPDAQGDVLFEVRTPEVCVDFIDAVDDPDPDDGPLLPITFTLDLVRAG